MEKQAKGFAFINDKAIDDDGSEMSLPEKTLMRAVTGEQPELPYPTRELKVAWGKPQVEYIIPDADREAVLRRLCFLRPAPPIDAEMLDLHERRLFRVRDFRVIRWRGANLLASPYFPQSGGMLVDWAAPGSGDVIVSIIRAGKEADGNGREED